MRPGFENRQGEEPERPIGEGTGEVTAAPHTGCAKFTRRFGLEVHRWINGHVGKQHRLRGICAKVVVPGTITTGDEIVKLH